MSRLQFVFAFFCISAISTIQCYPATYIKNDNPGYAIPGPTAPCAQEVTYNNIYSNGAGIVGNNGLYPPVIGTPIGTPIGSPVVNVPGGVLETVVTNPALGLQQVAYPGNPLLYNNVVAPSMYPNVVNPFAPNLIDNSYPRQVVANNNPLVAQSPYLSNRGNIYNM